MNNPSTNTHARIELENIAIGDHFRVNTRHMRAGGIVTKVNRTMIVYDAPYMACLGCPDGVMHNLKIRKYEMQGCAIVRPTENSKNNS